MVRKITRASKVGASFKFELIPLFFLTLFACSQPPQKKQSGTPTEDPHPYGVRTQIQDLGSPGFLSVASKNPGFDYAFEKLARAGAGSSFLKRLKSATHTQFQEKIIRTNLLGFRIKPDYSGHISSLALESLRRFLDQYEKTFSQTQAETQVPPEVIAALIWVETRIGKNTGSFPIAQALLDIASIDHPYWVQFGLQALEKEVPRTSPEYTENVEKLLAAAERKSSWAIEELLALEKVAELIGQNPTQLKGSYAGAFGYAQFIPSSYLKWARSTRAGSPPNLHRPEDAILSVGNYLKQNGWAETPESQTEALYHYNRSRAYGRTILELAALLKSEPLQLKGVEAAWRERKKSERPIRKRKRI